MNIRRLLAPFSRKHHAPSSQSVSFYSKIIMLVEAGVICFFIFWFAEQYQYDQYFQGYVNSTVQANLVALELGATLATFLAAAFFAMIRRAQAGLGPIRLEVVGSLNRNMPEPETGGAGQKLTGRNEPDASPALASAAVRVLKRMGPGQPLPTQPLFQKTKPVLKQVQPQQPTEARREIPSEEKRSRAIMGLGSKSGSERAVHRTPPSAGPGLSTQRIDNKPALQSSPVIERWGTPKPTGQFQPSPVTPPLQKPATVITGVDSGRSPVEKRIVPETTRSQGSSQPSPGSTENSRDQKPQARPVRITPGPLENPLPDDPLVSVSRSSQRNESLDMPPQRPLSSTSGGLGQTISAGESSAKTTSVPKLAERAQAIANRLPADKTPMVVIPAEKLQTPTKPQSQEKPEPSAFPPTSATDYTSQFKRAVQGEPVQGVVAEPSERRLLPSLGRVEPVRGVMEKPSTLKVAPVARRDVPAQPPTAKPAQPIAPGSSRTEPPRTTRGAGAEKSLSGHASAEESLEEKQLNQRRPLSPKKPEPREVEEDDSPII